LIEVSDIDAVGRAMDRCLDGLAPMTVSLGRHWNDQMISFYLRTPSGFDIEYGFGGRRVGPERWGRGGHGGAGRPSAWGRRRGGRHGAQEQLGPPADGPRGAPRPATRPVAERVAAWRARVWRWVGCRFWVSWAAWSGGSGGGFLRRSISTRRCTGVSMPGFLR